MRASPRWPPRRADVVGRAAHDTVAFDTAAPDTSAGDDVLEAVLDSDDEVVVRAIRDVALRSRCDVSGVVASLGRAAGSTVALDIVVADGTGRLLCHFFGRDTIPGVVVGSRVRVSGRLVTYRSRRCLLNPAYELVAGASGDASDVSS